MDNLEVGSMLMCFTNNSGFTIGKNYRIIGKCQVGEYGECVKLINDNGQDEEFSINKIYGVSYATWFKDIKKNRMDKLRKLNFIS